MRFRHFVAKGETWWTPFAWAPARPSEHFPVFTAIAVAVAIGPAIATSLINYRRLTRYNDVSGLPVRPRLDRAQYRDHVLTAVAEGDGLGEQRVADVQQR